MEIQPHAKRGSRSALLLISALLLKISQIPIRKFGALRFLCRVGPSRSVCKDTNNSRNLQEYRELFVVCLLKSVMPAVSLIVYS